MSSGYEATPTIEEMSAVTDTKPTTMDDLLSTYRKPEGEYSILEFDVPAGIHVYNTSRQFMLDGEAYILGRTEKRDDQFSSKVIPFRFVATSNKWVADSSVSNLSKLTAGKIVQDPQISHVGGEWVVNCIEVQLNDKDDPSAGCVYWTNIFSGERLDDLKLLTKSPETMKCVRLVELENGQVGVFTRPQSPGDPSRGGRGKIGFCVVDRLSDIDATVLHEAPLMYDLFGDEEWGGVNDVRLMPDGRLLALGHIARFLTDSPIEGDREYHSIVFEFDPYKRAIGNVRMVSKVEDMELERLPFEIEPKKQYLNRVEYPNALGPEIDLQSDSVVLIKSVRDSVQVMQNIPNPVAP